MRSTSRCLAAAALRAAFSSALRCSGVFFADFTVTEAAALAFGLAEAADLRVTPVRSSEVYRSFMGLRWDMLLWFSFKWSFGW